MTSKDRSDPVDSKKNDQLAFFLMPGNALRSLSDELAISIGEQAKEGILFRYGVRCGEGMVQRLGFTCPDMIAIAEMLPGMWSSVGLGRMQLKEISEQGMLVVLKESIEARTNAQGNQGCHFTRGYLSGMSSSLAAQKVVCIEEDCPPGDEFCGRLILQQDDPSAPAAEEPSPAVPPTVSSPAFHLAGGSSYLLKDDAPDGCYSVFLQLVTGGHQGLCITRDYPDRVRQRYNLVKTPILWLSNSDSPFSIEPVQLGKLYHKIEDFLKRGEKPVVMLSGLEYIITQNNYTSALKFLQLIKDQVAIHDGILLIPLSPSTLNERDLKMIERELETIAP